MPNYKRKLVHPLTDEEFLEGMKKGKFVTVPDHVGLVTFLHYSAVRISEALKLIGRNFWIEGNNLYVDVGIRLKHSKSTPPLPLPLDAPYMDAIVETVARTPENERVWAYCRATGWLIVKRVFHYPHYHRLSRITNFFSPQPDRPEGYSIAEVRAWTGLSLNALNFYVGLVQLERMGRSLGRKTEQKR